MKGGIKIYSKMSESKTAHTCPTAEFNVCASGSAEHQNDTTNDVLFEELEHDHVSGYETDHTIPHNESNNSNPNTNPRTQKERKERKKSAWEDELQDIQRDLIVEMYGETDQCSESGCSSKAGYRCVDCNTKDNYCAEHLKAKHINTRSRIHTTQSLELDQVIKVFRWNTLSVPLWGVTLDIRCQDCSSSCEEKTVNFINKNGQQVRNLLYCCQTQHTALISVGYFPATPSRPVTAFCIDMLKDFRSLNLICKVNQKTYAEHIVRSSHTKYDSTEVEVYRSMQGCYRAFSFIYGQMMKGKTVHEPSRIDCPCCTFSEDAVATVTFDVCFGCTGKEARAQNPVRPFHGEAYVLEDLTEEEVMNDVNLKINTPNTNQRKVLPGDCELRATEYTGTAASPYYKGLRFTGLMGSICKHGFPWFFMNVMYGKEKLVFASKVWEHLRAKFPKRMWNAKYDIMCVFEKYLSDRGRPLPNFTGIPAGHSKFHRMLCQLLWGPLFVEYMGLSCGEEIETLWRDLMQIWARLQEMSPENRIDELTDHLLYLADICIQTIHEKLISFAARAEKTLLQAKEAIKNSTCGLTEVEADLWYAQYSATLKTTKETPFWQEIYAGYLDDLYNKRWVLDHQYRKGVTLRSITQLKKLIDDLEKQKNISSRWLPNSNSYDLWTKRAWEREKEFWRRKVIMADNDQFFYIHTSRHQKYGRKGYKKRIEAAKLIGKSSIARQRALDKWNDYNRRLFPQSGEITLEQFTARG
jgi:hypothetical protein